MTDLALFDAPPQPAQTTRRPLTLHEAFTLGAIFGYLGSAPQHGATLTDLFAGAGGSSTGALQAGGTVQICANHWQTAVDIHAANHPLTDHAIVDLHQERPSFFPRTDILWASPECTKWSPASGEKGPAIEEGLFEDPLSDDAKRRSRLLMFDVLRYIEHHRYHLVIVENVVDIATQAKYRTAWTIWRQELRALGYAFRVISLNSMHAQAYGTPAPQSRDRIYIVAWPERAKAPDLDRVLRPRSYCAHCDTIIEAVQAFKPGRDVGRYRQAYLYKCSRCNTVVEPYWLPALAAVDWSLPGERIGDRLKDKTRLRIAWGIARYWGDPFQIENAGNVYDASDPKHPQHGDPNGYYRAYPISDPFRTISTWGDAKALAVPVEAREGKQAATVDEPLRTQTTRAETGLAQMPTGGIDAAALPFIAELYGTSTARPITAPAGTFTAGGNHHALVHRHNDGGAEMTTPASEYLRTLTTGGNVSLLSPGRDIPQHERRTVTDADLRRALEFLPEVRFRMFEPREVAAGMAFPADYVWQPTGLRHISKRNIVKAAGNAVTPPTARDLLAVSAESLAAG